MTFVFVERHATIWPVRRQLFSVALPNQVWLADNHVRAHGGSVALPGRRP